LDRGGGALVSSAGPVRQVGAGGDAGRDDGDSLAAGDEIVFVFDGFDERAVGGRGEGPGLIADIEKGHYFND
jgi:hypothetical protein